MTPGADPTAYAPQSVPPPGETLKETLEVLGIPQADLARRTGLSTKHINQVIQGTAPLSPDTALLLERATGVSAGMWNAREAAWRTQLAREEEELALADHVGWLNRFPLRELVSRNILPDDSKSVPNLRKLLEFFGVATPEVAENVWRGYQTAFRRSSVASRNEYATATWLRLAEREARERDCEPYDRAALIALLPRLRAMTLEDQNTWLTGLPRLCAEVGVAVVFIPAFAKTSVSGATRWLTPDKVMVVLSDRFKKDDQFWFSFFHELAHVLLHGKRLTFMDDSENLSPAKQHEDTCEDEANDFAAHVLLPPEHAAAYRKLASTRHLSLAAIDAFAHTIGVAPGIVVGRLQHDGALQWSHGNGLKRTVTLT
ncbi:ImmA/IrrE family metallo-endopeptidase [Streptomyces anthocyanicus]|uniref:ImmA/IrrE family metallo-endopeptidase n=1 Tax=Streptomyces fuscus TaxID=3048495 RepID=A0ABT7J219_9ACTN|nr:ImmA/IrrE family metallo-endopeptidase [Streptomyces fuscus]MDL2077653.1 ImmA/IrrE family metallo-endopeptidase [Streptomyces fuscus]